MRVLVTGGAGFIGRWVVKRLLEESVEVYILDNLSNGQEENLEEFRLNPKLKEFLIGDIRDRKLLADLFGKSFDLCIHLAAQINVQDSIDNPTKTYDVNVNGTFYIMEQARRYNTKLVLVGTCMVYDTATISRPIDEQSPTKPASPYAASKLAAENLAISYYHAYGLPVTVLRPFNTYGPYQKSNMEGGVVSIFISQNLEGKTLNVFGDGNQTRDLLYIEDCADFIVRAALSDKANGEILNAGYGEDIIINNLALLIASSPDRIKHVKHIHHQSEIARLVCDYSKAKELLNWQPRTPLSEGIKKTEAWLRKREKEEA
jgi:nucleoside-diphosphate-sugar epimerase